MTAAAQPRRFVSYLRVSTEKQGRSGLGLEAQREAVAAFLNGGRWELVGEFVEVESGKRNSREELAKALERCRLTGATLVVAKLDRLARNAAFLLNLRDAGVKFVAADMPEANELTIGILAVVAEAEGKAISARTKAALAAAKARGATLGGWKGGPKVDSEAGREAQRERADAFARQLAGTVLPMREAGLSLRQIAAELTAKHIRTARGGAWTAAAVREVLARLEAAKA